VREGDKKAFEDLKRRFAHTLCSKQTYLDQPFFITSDASDLAVGAQLCQDFDGVRRTVGLFSRKLTQGQLNWENREKELYVIVACLHKWSGIINFQPIVVQTDHRAPEHRVTEHVDTPSGPRRRRGCWHEGREEGRGGGGVLNSISP